VHDMPELIQARTMKRDGKSMSTNIINEFQVLELTRAEEISKELGIPFAKIQSFNQVEFESILNEFLHSN